MCRTQNERLEHVKNAHQWNALGKVISLLTAQPASHCDLHTLHCPTSGQITDHYEIHSRVTSFFNQWYEAPLDVDAAAYELTHTPRWWKQLLDIPAESANVGLHPKSAIPQHLQQGLRKACAMKASPEIQQAIRDTIDRIVTFEEFSDAIDSLREGSAPGSSGCTPNMIRAWNPAVRRLIYTHMLNVWQYKACSIWFRDKVIK